jgi:pyruvate dehydrogenase E2 component (dihydrolipoamide acetyltransferase)
VEKAAKAVPKKEVVPPSDKALAMRKAIAAAMSRSKREIPHYYLSQLVPMQRAQDWLTTYNEKRPVAERLLMGALQLKAVALALKDFPDFNGFWKDNAFQPAQGIHVGVAISLRQGGLIAPAIHDVAERSLDELMKALADLVRRARAGSLRSSEMSDPTITVTNLGDQGVDEVFPIIYPPQVAIVGFGRLAPRPWAEDGMIGAVPAVVASLGGDHRASDGHRGARFLAAVAALLQEPEKL